MSKKKRQQTKPKRPSQGKAASGSGSSWTARLRKTSRKSWLAAFAIAIAFWSGVAWLWSLREETVSNVRQHRELAIETRLFLQEIGIALANYKSVNGTVPASLSEERGAAILFENLLAGSERFLGPRPDRIRRGDDDEPAVIIDSWGNPIQYRSGQPAGKPVTPNPDYDLWSTGGDPENPPEKWITP